jgi:hypothetical protein
MYVYIYMYKYICVYTVYVYIYMCVYYVIFAKWPPSKLPNPMSHPPCSPPAHSKKSEEMIIYSIYPISPKALPGGPLGISSAVVGTGAPHFLPQSQISSKFTEFLRQNATNLDEISSKKMTLLQSVALWSV